MPRVSGLKTNRTNSPNISSLILIAGDLILIFKNKIKTRGSSAKNSLLVLKSPDSLVIVAQSVSVAVTLSPLRNPLQI